VVVAAPQSFPTALPIVVTAENLTRSQGDLCAAFVRSISKLQNTNTLGVGGFEVHVQLSKLASSPDVSCKLSISVLSNGSYLASASGSAKASVSGRYARRDCIDVVLEDMMVRKVVPQMLQHVSTLTGSSNTGSGSRPTAPAPTPVQPTP
jgi:hypothetical protein